MLCGTEKLDRYPIITIDCETMTKITALTNEILLINTGLLLPSEKKKDRKES